MSGPRPPPAPSLAAYALQVLIFHTLSAALAELVFTRKGFAFPAVYGAVEFIVFSMAPLAVWVLRYGLRDAVLHAVEAASERRETPYFVLCGCFMVVSHGVGLAANVRINYTTAMLFSAARLPAVLIMDALMQRRGYGGRRAPPAAAHMAALFVALGLGLFGLGERQDAPRFSTSGLILVGTNLVLGAVTFNLQQRILHRIGRGSEPRKAMGGAAAGALVARLARSGPEQPSNAERMMAVMYFAGALLFFVYAVATGEFAAFQVWNRSEDGRGALWALAPIACGAVLTSFGVRALLAVVADFDAARASTITSMRKVFTFVLSYMLFPKTFGGLHLLGVGLTIGGSIGVNHFLSCKDKDEIV